MKLHYLQHVPFEDPAYMLEWARHKKLSITRTLFGTREKLPRMDQFDFLVIMGGPMNIYEHERYPWLVEEKKFIKQAILDKKKVLGVCLGAQLIADVLGAPVTPNEKKEIGWFDIELTWKAQKSHFFSPLPRRRFPVFHWHGDTFALPSYCTPLATSKGCKNQAFEYGHHVLALQFHLESTIDSIRKLIHNCLEDLTPGTYVQKEFSILRDNTSIHQTHQFLDLILNRFIQR